MASTQQHHKPIPIIRLGWFYSCHGLNWGFLNSKTLKWIKKKKKNSLTHLLRLRRIGKSPNCRKRKIKFGFNKRSLGSITFRRRDLPVSFIWPGRRIITRKIPSNIMGKSQKSETPCVDPPHMWVEKVPN